MTARPRARAHARRHPAPRAPACPGAPRAPHTPARPLALARHAQATATPKHGAGAPARAPAYAARAPARRRAPMRSPAREIRSAHMRDTLMRGGARPCALARARARRPAVARVTHARAPARPPSRARTRARAAPDCSRTCARARAACGANAASMRPHDHPRTRAPLEIPAAAGAPKLMLLVSPMARTPTARLNPAPCWFEMQRAGPGRRPCCYSRGGRARVRARTNRAPGGGQQGLALPRRCHAPRSRRDRPVHVGRILEGTPRARARARSRL